MKLNLVKRCKIIVILFSFIWTTIGIAQQRKAIQTVKWIGLQENAFEPNLAPKNLFTYFRKVVELDSLPSDATLHFGADSNARLWINGKIVRRKVSRYNLHNITVDEINTAPYLQHGENVILVLHHNWGNIQTFQRTGNRGPALFVRSEWVSTGDDWKMIQAPEFIQHDKQIIGVPGTPRVRYPLVIDARNKLTGDLHSADYNDSKWNNAVAITDAFYPEEPLISETSGQQEYPVRPSKIIAAGMVELDDRLTNKPEFFGLSMKNSDYRPDKILTTKATNLINKKPLTLEGKKGDSYYITVDFFKPVHGFPFINIEEASEGIKIDFGYTEISRSQYDGSWHVDHETGWIDPTGVVGDRYADRYITKSGSQYAEIPDERTARWVMIRVHFEEDGYIRIDDTGFNRSQYPVDFVGSFSSGNQHIDQIINLSITHALITMTDSYQDTPGREDGQWYEDARLRAKLTARWFGDIKLREFMIRTVAESQREDGRFHDFPPSNYPFLSTYDWNMQWVAILHDQYMWAGDTKLIKEYWDQLELFWKNVLSLVNEDGVWITNDVRDDIRVSARLDENQSSGIVTPSIIERLEWSVNMAKTIGETERAEEWEERLDTMRDAFRKYHIVPTEGDRPAYVANRYDINNPNIDRGFGQAAQVVPVFTNLLTMEESKKVLSYTFTEPHGNPPAGVDRWNNPTFIYRVLRALSHVDKTELAVNHMIERFSQYLPSHPNNPIPLELQGPYGGPLPEYWISREDADVEQGEILNAQPVDDTGSHGWASIPLLWLHDSLLGVKIAEPGGGKLNIAPEMGGLPFVQGYTNTPKGIVWISLNSQTVSLEVQIPASVVAEISLPEIFLDKKVNVNNDSGNVNQINNKIYKIEGKGLYIFSLR